MDDLMSKQPKRLIFSNLAQTSLVKLQKAAHFIAKPMFSMVCMRQDRVAHCGAPGALYNGDRLLQMK
jgi:hypothetical protein